MSVAFVRAWRQGYPATARNLSRAGLLTAVWNRTPDKARQLAAELKVAAPATLAELASQVDAVVSCVSADADVLEVVRGLSPGLKSGALVLDCSTIGAETARQAAQLLEPKGAQFLDCPVSGGVEGARDGTLAIGGGRGRGGVRAAPSLVLKATLGRTHHAYFRPDRQRPGRQGHAIRLMCAGIIDATRRSDGCSRHGPGAAARQTHRHPRQGGGLVLVLREPRAEHDARDISGGFPGAAACQGPRHLPRHGGALRRGAAGGRAHAEGATQSSSPAVAGDEDISVTYLLKEELFERTNIRRAPSPRPA